MKNDYSISGDGTGITYGIYKGNIFKNPVMVKSGIKTFAQAQKEVRKLENEKSNDFQMD